MLSEQEKKEIQGKIERLKSKQKLIKMSLHTKDDDKINTRQNSVRFAHVGFEFVGSFLLFFFVGLYLDKKLNADSLVLISSIFAGFILSIYRLIRSVQKEE